MNPGPDSQHGLREIIDTLIREYACIILDFPPWPLCAFCKIGRFSYYI
jgi:hypothetical protein